VSRVVTEAAGYNKTDGKQRRKERRGRGLEFGRLRSWFVQQSRDNA
jgi:hypothetical protein